MALVKMAQIKMAQATLAHITKWVKLAQFVNITIWVGFWNGGLGLGF